LVAKRLASRSSGLDFGRLLEQMPENAPPKLMFRNISAIRENTERILQLLEASAPPPGLSRGETPLAERADHKAPDAQFYAPSPP
jgi:hypothetical protein